MPPAASSGGHPRAHWMDGIANPVRLQIVRALSETDEASTAELVARTEASYQTLRRHLDVLRRFEVVEALPGRSDGETSGRPATRFRLAPGVRDGVRAMFGGAS